MDAKTTAEPDHELLDLAQRIDADANGRAILRHVANLADLAERRGEHLALMIHGELTELFCLPTHVLHANVLPFVPRAPTGEPEGLA